MNGLRYAAERTIEIDVLPEDIGGPYEFNNYGVEYTEHLERALRRHGINYIASCARMWVSGKALDTDLEFTSEIVIECPGTYRIQFQK